MKEGKVTVNITNALIQGEAGVGKTSTKHILFNKPPPKVRTSTPLAEPPVQVRVNNPTSQSTTKNISDVKVRSLGSSWQAFNDSQLQEIVTDAVAATHHLNKRSLLKSSCDKNSDLATSDEFMQIAKKSVFKEREKLCSSSSQTENPNSQNIAESVEVHSVDNSSNIAICKNRSENDHFEEIARRSVHDKVTADNENSHIPSEEMPSKTSHYEQSDSVAPCSSSFQTAFANIHSKIVYLTDERNFEATADMFGTNWIYFIDSGGQPHFHNLLPHFVHGISVALFVHCLSRKLDEYPVVEYFEKDQSVAAPYKSPLSTEDTLKCLVRSMQSHTIDGEKPKLVFIGTFLDKISKSSETLSEKNAKLLALLTPDFVDQLVFCAKDFSELIFPLNAKNPGDDEQRVCTKIREAVESSHSRKVDMPIWWYILEITLKELSSVLGRMVFSKRECLEVARRLGISDDALDVDFTISIFSITILITFQMLFLAVLKCFLTS